MDFQHKPVLVAEVLELLEPARRSTIVDCTLGGAGHSKSILDLLPADSWLVGIDQDDDALAAAGKILAGHENVKLIKGNFGQLDVLLSGWNRPIDGFLFDLGVSSWQLDNPERGFAYQHDAPLDMRMNQEGALSAYTIVNSWSAREMTKIFRTYGEEKWSSRVAAFIVTARENKPIETTGELVDIIKAAIPAAARREGGHPGRRIFQALRIAVNAELDNLRLGLEAALEICAPGGVVAAISYHSLEDRIVKLLFKDKAAGCICPPEVPVCQCNHTPEIRILTKKPIGPGIAELENNPRSRSAKLRAAAKLGSNER
ncbi:MAG: 16S rRNA (cytosine(1402)-N(4))-methyltransferase RsmH [Eubacteriales bacterium]|nr:16S rRNA (cytosine(1402)-N(4))-methyltransferase RsmH [Eubacteriales bacterium]MDD3073143.1 16S rRNA (cytosine(1402)-N(4))-methyltransferase RsmH [Eubacteriales bacterium]MDD4078187.1 16S rRNA (cytosine(1402)-N(4))-methyltransferase RsmH [Eubacteriales bacterium]MDD4768574.1 16S rRNA (cytosine(1402)-N(4))-methyltransferase RsmH [Eubacteriales bacterium]